MRFKLQCDQEEIRRVWREGNSIGQTARITGYSIMQVTYALPTDERKARGARVVAEARALAKRRRAEALELFKQGLNLTEIDERLGLRGNSCYYIPVEMREERKRARYASLHAKLYEAAMSGVPYKDIGRRFNIKPNLARVYVHYYARINKLKPPRFRPKRRKLRTSK